MKFLLKIFRKIRYFLLVVIGIGLPIYIYLGFIAKEPVLDVAYDVEFGLMSAAEIAADTVEFPVLPREDYADTYAYLDEMVEELVASPAIQYQDLFKYDSVLIINRDDVLNAFCTPGGHIYVYTGLIKYLDHPDHLAGVLGHEIAHAELRHSSIQLQQKFGRKQLVAFVALYAAGSVSDLISLKILNDLVNLGYSRDQEAAADRASVDYLSTTPYACNGCGGFFEKLVNEGNDVAIPEFLSDHPNSAARISDINKKATEIGCNTQLESADEWRRFQATLPDTTQVKTEPES